MSEQVDTSRIEAKSPTNGSIIDLLKSRASNEFVIGVMGAVGCGLARVVTEFEVQLIKLDYASLMVSCGRACNGWRTRDDFIFHEGGEGISGAALQSN